MIFDEILETLESYGKSGLAYEKTIERTDLAMQQDPERAIAYRLLGTLAERFIESTGRLPVTTTTTEDAFRKFESVVSEMKAVYASDNAPQILAILNDVAISSRERIGLVEDIQS